MDKNVDVKCAIMLYLKFLGSYKNSDKWTVKKIWIEIRFVIEYQKFKIISNERGKYSKYWLTSWSWYIYLNRTKGKWYHSIYRNIKWYKLKRDGFTKSDCL